MDHPNHGDRLRQEPSASLADKDVCGVHAPSIFQLQRSEVDRERPAKAFSGVERWKL